MNQLCKNSESYGITTYPQRVPLKVFPNEELHFAQQNYVRFQALPITQITCSATVTQYSGF